MVQIRQRLQILIRLMWLLCSITAVIAVSLIITALRPTFHRTVEARKFVLRDSVGRVRAEMSVDAAGNASLFFLDSLGRKKAVLK
ncbi:MAG: hypothetical protein EAZ92_09095 [Candidatus Kapaibacterium sp.]|nr:MAG: hypothetical protein EAZ92_09095 [Candidatus Kapabacteria bacterium]